MTDSRATDAAAHRAADAVAHALPLTQMRLIFLMALWLYRHADALGPAALNELADKLRPLRKESDFG